MVEAKPTVMALGTIGTGKSTFLNHLGGGAIAQFEAGRCVTGLTQEPQEVEFADCVLIDTPGLNDTRIPTADWCTRFNQAQATQNGKVIDLALMIFKQSERPTSADANIAAVLKQVIETVNARTVAIVFTFCDQSASFDIDYAHEWYHRGLIENMEGMPQFPKSRIFLMKGSGDDATTSRELKTWIQRTLQERTRIKEFVYDQYLVDTDQSCSVFMQTAASSEVDLLKRQLAGPESQMKLMQNMMKQMRDQSMTPIQKQNRAQQRLDGMQQLAIQAQARQAQELQNPRRQMEDLGNNLKRTAVDTGVQVIESVAGTAMQTAAGAAMRTAGRVAGTVAKVALTGRMCNIF